MTKSITTISLDSNTLEIARSRDINLSGVINSLLDQYLEMDKFKVSDIIKLESEIGEKSAELNALKSHLIILKREGEKKEKEIQKIEETELKKLQNMRDELRFGQQKKQGVERL